MNASDFEQNTLINGKTPFFPDNSIMFFQTSLEENKGKSLISIAYLTNIRLHSRFLGDVDDVHYTPSCHKWSDFDHRPWCLATPVRTLPNSNRGTERRLYNQNDLPFAKKRENLSEIAVIGQSSFKCSGQGKSHCKL